jgi:hypothetical protein
MVCAAPQAPEKIVKITTDETRVIFRPIWSLNLAMMTMKAACRVSKCTMFAVAMHTSVCQQICGNDPAAATKLREIIRYGYEGRADDGDLEINEEDAQDQAIHRLAG